MKKLLVLMLVLGMTSVASAALSVVQVGDTLNVEVTGTLEADGWYVLSTDGALSSIGLGTDAPNISTKGGPTSDLGGMGHPVGFTGEYWILADSGNPYPIIGQFLVGTGAAFGDQVALGWFDEIGGMGVINTITLVPEPMTIALLGLGGLFMIRRRKK